MRTGILIAVILQGIGAAIKALINIHISFMLIGQAFCAIASPFLISSIALIPTIWFEDSKRISAINMCCVSHALGSAFGFLISILLVSEDASDKSKEKLSIFYSLLIQACIGLVISFLVILTLENEPPSPPSKTALVERDDDIIGTVRLLLTNRDFLKITFIFAFYFTVVTTLGDNAITIAKEFDYNHRESLPFVFAIVSGGILGIFAVGSLLHHKRWYKAANVGIGILTMINLSLLCVFLLLGNKTLITIV